MNRLARKQLPIPVPVARVLDKLEQIAEVVLKPSLYLQLAQGVHRRNLCHGPMGIIKAHVARSRGPWLSLHGGVWLNWVSGGELADDATHRSSQSTPIGARGSVMSPAFLPWSLIFTT